MHDGGHKYNLLGKVYNLINNREMVEIHKNLNISNQQFDKFKTHLRSIATDLEATPEDIEELLDLVE